MQASLEFLYEMERNRDTFTGDELVEASGWAEKTARIYLSKKLEELVVEVEEDTYRVSPIMQRVRPSEYARLFSQKQTLFTEYQLWQYPDVVIYDFFLPLTRENRLREGLDKLFYRDAVIQLLREIGADEVENAFGQGHDETPDELLQRVAGVVGDKFVGYSIQHVDGRFRSADFLTKEEAGERPLHEGPYLVDETTAIVRFIMRCTTTRVDAEDGLDQQLELETRNVEDEIEETEWIFFNLFAEAVIKQVDYEEEIWLLETGRTGESGQVSKLWVWEAE